MSTGQDLLKRKLALGDPKNLLFVWYSRGIKLGHNILTKKVYLCLFAKLSATHELADLKYGDWNYRRPYG